MSIIDSIAAPVLCAVIEPILKNQFFDSVVMNPPDYLK